jgi:hypothetical protein
VARPENSGSANVVMPGIGGCRRVALVKGLMRGCHWPGQCRCGFHRAGRVEGRGGRGVRRTAAGAKPADRSGPKTKSSRERAWPVAAAVFDHHFGRFTSRFPHRRALHVFCGWDRRSHWQRPVTPGAHRAGGSRWSTPTTRRGWGWHALTPSGG